MIVTVCARVPFVCVHRLFEIRISSVLVGYCPCAMCRVRLPPPPPFTAALRRSTNCAPLWTPLAGVSPYGLSHPDSALRKAVPLRSTHADLVSQRAQSITHATREVMRAPCVCVCVCTCARVRVVAWVVCVCVHGVCVRVCAPLSLLVFMSRAARGLLAFASISHLVCVVPVMGDGASVCVHV